MRLAFVCDTPYQVLTAVNLYWTSFYAKKQIADLYIVDQFKDAKNIYTKIEKEKLFDNVYFLSREENRFMPTGMKRYLKVAYSYLNPANAVRNQSNEIKPHDLKNKYDKIFSSVMTCFVSALVKMNKNAEFNLFDDGMGSYSGDIVKSGGGFAYKIFSKITKTGACAERASHLYVNNKDMCRSQAADTICQIPKMSQEFLQIADRIFSVEKSSCVSKNIIFLSQPSNGLKSLEDDMQNLINTLYLYKDKIMVRLHPRETDYDKYRGFQIDNSREFWELKVSKMDMQDMVLIGDYSTAQITPKLLFDKEPWLLMTYHLAITYTEEEKASFDKVVSDVKAHYNEKEKVMIPRNEEEFKTFLKKVIELNRG